MISGETPSMTIAFGFDEPIKLVLPIGVERSNNCPVLKPLIAKSRYQVRMDRISDRDFGEVHREIKSLAHSAIPKIQTKRVVSASCCGCQKSVNSVIMEGRKDRAKLRCRRLGRQLHIKEFPFISYRCAAVRYVSRDPLPWTRSEGGPLARRRPHFFRKTGDPSIAA